MGKKKGKKAVDISDLFSGKYQEEDDIVDAEFRDIDDIKKAAKSVGSKSDIRHRTEMLSKLADELKYEAAASKFKKEKLEEDIDEPANDKDVEKLRRAAIAAVQAFAEKAGVEQKYAQDVIDMLQDSSPEKTVKIAERIQDEIGKSEKLQTLNDWLRRGKSGLGWYFDKDNDKYQIDTYGIPMDKEAAAELGRILKKYSNPLTDDNGWNGYWGPMAPNQYEEERLAKEANMRSQASYQTFLKAALN